MKVVAIDFETANAQHTSPCSIGLAWRNRDFIQTSHYLIHQEPCDFAKKNIAIHGITPETVMDVPCFSEIWQEVQPILENSLVIAHNASFDISVLTKTLDLYHLPYPKFEYFCTMRLAQTLLPDLDNFKLDFLCKTLDIDLKNHHTAACDAQACLLLYEKMRNLAGTSWQTVCEDEGLETGLLYHKATGQNIHQKMIAPAYYQHSETKHRPSYYGERISVKEINAINTVYEDDDFMGKSFCITGELSIPRKKAMEIISKLGGTVTSGITKKTNFLLTGSDVDYNGSKIKKALASIEAGQEIQIIDEGDFLRMIDDEAWIEIC